MLDRTLQALCGVGAAAAVTGLAGATTVMFDFEDVPLAQVSNAENAGLLSSLSMTKGGLTAQLSRTSGASFDVFNIDQNFGPSFVFPPQWGTRSLSPFANFAISDAFVVNFSGGTVSAVDIEYGDFGGDSGDVRFQAWDGPNGTGNLLSNLTQSYNGNLTNGDVGTFNASAAGIASITFWGEVGSFPMSLYWDNMRVEFERAVVIPLPTGAGLAGLGLMVVAIRRRRGA